MREIAVKRIAVGFYFSLIFLTIAFFFSCMPASTSNPVKQGFSDTPISHSIMPGIIDEASGLADSKSNPGYLWVEQDSGNPPALNLLGYDGKPIRSIPIKGSLNRDWEDMALATDPLSGQSVIYLADIGDNLLSYTNYFIYRFPEPASSADSVFTWEKLTFTYPDGAHDAEAILVDSRTKEIYIITKNDEKAKVFKLAYPQTTAVSNSASFVTELPFKGVVSAAMSPDSKEIIIKTYTALYYWNKAPDETIDNTLKKSSSLLSYQLEAQDEAVCFSNNNGGFFTLSERPVQAASVALNFYKRN